MIYKFGLGLLSGLVYEGGALYAALSGILTKISQIENVVKENKDIITIIVALSAIRKKSLGLCAES